MQTVTVEFEQIARETGVKIERVKNVVQLLDDENTVPFITRYRKERTGNLDEELIRAIQSRVQFVRQLQTRAQQIARLVEGQGKLTDELRAKILAAESLKVLEDLYLPFRPKRQTRATIAKEKGLAPLADAIWNNHIVADDLLTEAEKYFNSEHELDSTETVLRGASDIIAERLSEIGDVRQKSRRIAEKSGRICVSGLKTQGKKAEEFRNYFDYQEAWKKIPPHRVLAINRGERKKFLKVKLEWDIARAETVLGIFFRFSDRSCCEFLKNTLSDALRRLVSPSLERELRREITDKAEDRAVSVFGQNLKHLLLQPPMKGKKVLAIDPGFKSGCKLAVLDENGTCLSHDVMQIAGSQEKQSEAIVKFSQLLQEHEVELVAIGNGTACRESEEFVANLIETTFPNLRYVIVSEAGASVYSTNQVAREEFPDLDATVRGTISIGRRLQDPLSELVKIEPQHIGVGMYQHDIGEKRLKETLDQIVESCVNFVGVDLNAASFSLLKKVSGLNQLSARRIIEWRDQHGRFQKREQLKDVQGIGEATFTQAAGFLKINDGEEPLDRTWIHPESYEATRKLLEKLSIESDTLNRPGGLPAELDLKFQQFDIKATSEELHVGLPTLIDIVESLRKPGQDPRTEFPGPIFKKDVLKIEHLTEGMELSGTVTNVVDFGAFVDIGLKDSGLVHISHMSNKYVKSPHKLVTVGDHVKVWVASIDNDRRRISLSMVHPDQLPQKPTKAKKTVPEEKPAAAESSLTKASVQELAMASDVGNLALETVVTTTEDFPAELVDHEAATTNDQPQNSV